MCTGMANASGYACERPRKRQPILEARRLAGDPSQGNHLAAAFEAPNRSGSGRLKASQAQFGNHLLCIEGTLTML
jgi:hypothetical protein